ncbi:gamma-glutamyl-gamma-aminobutyrate hydrolase family protein [Fructilactobacillus sp. Tb1]|uniref:gamma-glutamyl-gamma-aminobutyrate hydrolase family protein n=1 Tax=Fructilactobacillus sp. Tb1 TaxID=3422304 RepID=UPI003D271771
MKIGIPTNINLLPTKNFNLDKANYTADVFINLLVSHGITPMIIPLVPNDMVKSYVDEIDGVIIPGGNDITPALFGEKPHAKLGKTYLPHDEFEIQIINDAIADKIPVLGICRGHQIINVALGGSLYQDLASQQPNVHEHNQPEPAGVSVRQVTVDKDSVLAKSVGTHPIVNSKHHQAVKDIANGMKVTAYSDDGVVEAMENADASIMGVQWHPEFLWENDPIEEQIFLDFFKRAAK